MLGLAIFYSDPYFTPTYTALPSFTTNVESCPQTRLDGGLSKLHSADDDAVAWLTSYGP